MTRMTIAAAALLAVLAAQADLSHAQAAWPSKPIKLIVPFPPGGGSDPVARVIAQGLSTRLGQQVYIDNRPGAQGTIGTAAAAKSAPDGYTLLLFVGALVADPLVAKEPSFDPVKDFTFITLVTSQPSLAVVGPQVKAANLREFIAEAKAKPGSLTFAYGSVSGRLTGELMMQLTGAKVLAVPYKGASPAMIDIAGGRVDRNGHRASPLPLASARTAPATAGRKSRRAATGRRRGAPPQNRSPASRARTLWRPCSRRIWRACGWRPARRHPFRRSDAKGSPRHASP